MVNIDLRLGDCLDIMPTLAAQSFDAIIADIPYGTTACKWDTIIPFAPMWENLKRLAKSRAAIVLFGSQPFTSALVMSNANNYKYSWYWRKSKPNGWQHAKNRPMQAIEELPVFSYAPMGHYSLLGDNRMQYFPQGIESIGIKKVTPVAHGAMMGARPNQVGREYEAFTGFPHNFLEYQNVIGDKAEHPTQKPVALIEYLVKTYTNEGDTVLDFTAGSGTLGVACVRTNRNAVLIEKETEYFEIAKRRIADAQAQLTLSLEIA